VLKFSNTSGKNTPLIEKASIIDFSFGSKEKGTFVLHHAKGSNAERSDFQPIDETMQVGKNIYMTPVGGRSSDNTAFPFFNIEMPGHTGIMVAVGWTGKWYADIRQLNRPDKGDGIIMAFRRKNCVDESISVKLRGIDPKESYELIEEDTQTKTTVSGEQLINGYTLNLNKKPGSLLIWYKNTP
jgi:hypothetical protein